MTSQQVKERTVEGHYEVEEVPYGKVYRWVPGQEEAIQGKPPLGEDEAYRPERGAYEEWLREEAHPHLRHYEWLELEDLLVRYSRKRRR